MSHESRAKSLEPPPKTEVPLSTLHSYLSTLTSYLSPRVILKQSLHWALDDSAKLDVECISGLLEHVLIVAGN